VADPCGLSDFNRIAIYGHAELFVALMGTGVSRSLYELTAHDAQTHVLLFDLRIEASTEALARRGIHYVDVGTSGGVWGLENGYCLMVGGSDEAFGRVEPALRTLAPEDGYAHVGPVGAGHFTKMVHNGIEYAMLQAYGEGFEILDASPFELDLHRIAALWNHGSVVRSWLLELAESAFAKDPDLSQMQGYVQDSGEGRWTVFEAINEDVPAPAIAASLFARFASRQEDSFAMRVIAALRNEFGGHAVKEK